MAAAATSTAALAGPYSATRSLVQPETSPESATCRNGGSGRSSRAAVLTGPRNAKHSDAGSCVVLPPTSSVTRYPRNPHPSPPEAPRRARALRTVYLLLRRSDSSSASRLDGCRSSAPIPCVRRRLLCSYSSSCALSPSRGSVGRPRQASRVGLNIVRRLLCTRTHATLCPRAVSAARRASSVLALQWGRTSRRHLLCSARPRAKLLPERTPGTPRQACFPAGLVLGAERGAAFPAPVRAPDGRPSSRPPSCRPCVPPKSQSAVLSIPIGGVGR
ncbi:hypothetical protein B0H15DRAFT_571024 [Mycena belliarum]|uniref:Uncharacterized protein n=1 Tax=Mycena belliarum TaxID=1033014 RepID=A0AAD6TVM4_9AGAR|nr:hypothetical protein B0H15DRAFT_571024 [Mycena belliae]